MKAKEYLELVDELNDSITDNKFFENLGISFSYTTNGYYDSIDFGDFHIYDSENDSLSKYDYIIDEYVDISLKEFIIQKLAELSKEMFNISQELQKIKI